MAHPPLLPLPVQIPGINISLGYSSPYNEHRLNTYDLNSKIMLTAIISVSVVVLVLITLHIYARFMLRRQARERAVLRRLGITRAADTHSGEPSRTGLDPAIIASLPIFVYKQVSAVHGGDESELECAVCLCGLEEEEMARILPNCKHIFHAECVDKWLNSHSNCPVCRTEAEPMILPVRREGPAAGDPVDCTSLPCTEESSSQKGSGSVSRLSSFRRMLSRERSSRTIQIEVQEERFLDLERQ
ncbi:RING-H2 finger protein ATL40-like [Euphorbia lathyris]|uniref:RING-H2 finger protein ATL40-like n=1 Tax=Euphorbia lathyris TaxID=212925 RepID=UPI0033134821